MFLRNIQAAFAISATLVCGQMALSKAEAQTATTATAQTAQGLIGGSVIVNGSFVKGDITAITYNATAASFSATGNNSYSNAYGGLADISLNAPIVPMQVSGSVLVTNSTLQKTNVTALDLTGSAIADSSLGYLSITKNVGTVTQDSLNPLSVATDAGSSGVISLTGVIMPAGSLSATALYMSIVSDTAGGPNTFVNNYGAYQSITLQGSGQSLVNGNMGVLSLTNSSIFDGNLSAHADIYSVESSNSSGPASVAESVGEVGKYTLDFTTISPTTSSSQSLIAGSVIANQSFVNGDINAITYNATAASFSATGNNSYSNAYGGLADISLNAPIAATVTSASVIGTDSTFQQTNITALDFTGSAIADSSLGYLGITKNVGTVTQDSLNPLGVTTDAGSSGVISLTGVIMPAGSLSATATNMSIVSDTAGGPNTFVNNYGAYQSITLQGSGQSLATGNMGVLSLTNTRVLNGNLSAHADIYSVESSNSSGPASVAESVGEVGKYTLDFTVVPATPAAQSQSPSAPTPNGPGG